MIGETPYRSWYNSHDEPDRPLAWRVGGEGKTRQGYSHVRGVPKVFYEKTNPAPHYLSIFETQTGGSSSCMAVVV